MTAEFQYGLLSLCPTFRFPNCPWYWYNQASWQLQQCKRILILQSQYSVSKIYIASLKRSNDWMLILLGILDGYRSGKKLNYVLQISWCFTMYRKLCDDWYLPHWCLHYIQLPYWRPCDCQSLHGSEIMQRKWSHGIVEKTILRQIYFSIPNLN